jgi:hypothetical protein
MTLCDHYVIYPQLCDVACVAMHASSRTQAFQLTAAGIAAAAQKTRSLAAAVTLAVRAPPR